MFSIGPLSAFLGCIYKINILDYGLPNPFSTSDTVPFLFQMHFFSTLETVLAVSRTTTTALLRNKTEPKPKPRVQGCGAMSKM